MPRVQRVRRLGEAAFQGPLQLHSLRFGAGHTSGLPLGLVAAWWGRALVGGDAGWRAGGERGHTSVLALGAQGLAEGQMGPRMGKVKVVESGVVAGPEWGPEWGGGWQLASRLV